MDKLPNQARIAAAVLAFDARNQLSAETRAALGHAAVVIVDQVLEDMEALHGVDGRLNAHWADLMTTMWLPSRWRLVATKRFLRDWAVALVSVAYGLGQEDWAGPACVGEEVALAAICQHALLLPDLFDMDAVQLKKGIDAFATDAFQDLDFEGLFEPAMDGIDKSRVGDFLGMSSLSFSDAFDPFPNRTGHPFHLDAGKKGA